MSLVRSHRVSVALLALLTAAPAHAALEVVCSLPDLGAIAREIGGEHANVKVLAHARQDPHYVDPRPSLLVALSRADLLVVNGLELEASWLTPLLTAARNAQIQVGAPGYFDASTSVELLQIPLQKIDRTMGDLHPGGNPHFSFDPRRMATIARALAARMGERDLAHADAYRARGEALAARLVALAVKERARFAALVDAKRQVVPYHQSLVYLSDWLALKEVVNVEPRPGIPPHPDHVARVLSTMKQTKTRVIVQEEFYPTAVSKTLIELAKGELVVLPGATRFDEGQSYEAHMQEVTDALYASLSK